MKSILTGLALMGLGAAAYKYRSEISNEIEGILPSAKSFKKAANDAKRAITSSSQDSYSSYASKAKETA